MPDKRDAEIAAALSMLEVRESPPSFWDALRERTGAEPERRPALRIKRSPVLAIALAVGICSLAAGTALGATVLGSDAGRSRPIPQSAGSNEAANTVSFSFTDGWNEVDSAIDIGAGQRQRMAWVSNDSISDQDSTTGWPTQTIEKMGPDQIVIWAAANTSVDTPEQYPQHDLPFALDDGPFKADQYGGQPAANVSEVGPIYGQVNGVYVTVYIWFGSNQPSDQVRQAAAEELRQLVVSQPATP